MKIAINTTSAIAGGGITYIKNLLHYLSIINTNHKYLILTTSSVGKTFHFHHPNFTFVSFKFPSQNSLSRILWEQFILPSFLKKEGVDILFSPANICPIFSRIPNVLVIQNVEPFYRTFLKNKCFIGKIRLKLLKSLTVLSIKRSKKVIFPSTNACNIVVKCGFFIKNAEVVYHGINKEIFYPRVKNDTFHHIKKKYGLDKFILYVSHIQRYKNFLELIKAFISLKDKIDSSIQLVFAGQCFDEAYYKEIQIFIKNNQYENRIFFLGNIPSEELPFLYSACTIFVYPSICESFGMTLVEAMACGAPILASRMEPMTEICRNAAYYFDPANPAEIAKAMCTVLKDLHHISKLSKKAKERATIFSWENTTTRMQKIFENAT